jgi:hypothetical protein
MPYYKSEFYRAPKVIKRRSDPHALRNVISLRVSDEELELLNRISRKSSRSISEIMREAFKSWQESQGDLCTEM